MKKLLSAIVALTLLLSCALPGALAEVDKKEMVYVLADADGSVNDVIVSERLYNRDGEAQLTDVSRLTDIENVGGDQTWTEENGNLVWNAGGADIRYEGSSTEPLPVTVSLRYTLDEVAVGDQLVTMPCPSSRPPCCWPTNRSSRTSPWTTAECWTSATARWWWPWACRALRRA